MTGAQAAAAKRRLAAAIGLGWLQSRAEEDELRPARGIIGAVFGTALMIATVVALLFLF